MPNPMIRIHNIETNEIIDREMTDSEFAAYEAENAAKAAEMADAAAKADTKASAIAKLAALGLTEDEAKAIIG